MIRSPVNMVADEVLNYYSRCGVAFTGLGEGATVLRLGAVVSTVYDGWDRKVETSGAIYPLLNEYDDRGERIALTTARTGTPVMDGPDTTRWTYDDLTGLCTRKRYADGSCVDFTYAGDGKPLRTTWPDGS